MIRPATVYDIDGVAYLLYQVAATLPGGSKAGLDHWLNDATTCIRNPSAISFVAEHDCEIVGFISGIIILEPNSDEKVCIEHPWASHPDKRSYGTELRREAEREAKRRGASRMIMHCPNDRIEKLLSRAGYKKSYTIYERVL